MLVPLVYEPLVHLVAEAQSVMLDAEICDSLQLTPAEHLFIHTK